MPLNTLPPLSDLAEQHPGWLDAAVDDTEASLITGLSKAALATRRCRGGGPPFIKDGKYVRYLRRDLLEWLYARRVRSTSESR
jgi:hypothetical protein